VQPRKLRIDAYLDKLWQIEKGQKNDLLRLQIADYRNYVSELVTIGQIMTKKFFVVVPMSDLKSKEKSFFSQLGAILSPSGAINLSQKSFIRKKKELDLRASHIQSGLESIGLGTQRLDTQALIELYYNVYNPDISHNQQLPDVNALQVER
jgi:hypothetical protein